MYWYYVLWTKPSTWKFSKKIFQLWPRIPWSLIWTIRYVLCTIYKPAFNVILSFKHLISTLYTWFSFFCLGKTSNLTILADLSEQFMRLESHKFSKLSFLLSQINKLLSSTINYNLNSEQSSMLLSFLYTIILHLTTTNSAVSQFMTNLFQMQLLWFL